MVILAIRVLQAMEDLAQEMVMQVEVVVAVMQVVAVTLE